MKVALRQRPWTLCHLALPIKLALELDLVHGRKVSISARRATVRVLLIILGRCLCLLVRVWSGRYAVFLSVVIPVCGSP